MHTPGATWSERNASRGGYVDPRPFVACRSERSGEIQSPHQTELARGLPVTEPGGRWALVRGALQLITLLQRGVPGPQKASFVTAGVHSTFKLMVSAHGRSPIVLVPHVLPVQRCPRLPQGAYLDFPSSREWEAVVARSRSMFTAFGNRPQDVFALVIKLEDSTSDRTCRSTP